MTKRGFTLIELLVVIAIIGILASIVLVSLSGARDRAKDARIQAAMSQIRSQGEIIRSDYGNYARMDCTTVADPCVCTDEGIQTLCTDIYRQGGTDFIVYINSTGSDAYCAFSKLNVGGYWCVDSGLKSEKDADGTLATCISTCEAGDSCACD